MGALLEIEDELPLPQKKFLVISPANDLLVEFEKRSEFRLYKFEAHLL